jgi:hypothetical protein
MAILQEIGYACIFKILDKVIKFKFKNLQMQSFPIYNRLKMIKLKIYLSKNLLMKYF